MTNTIRIELLHTQWKMMTDWVSGTLKNLPDDDLTRSIAPGRNHGVWLLGHLIESEDELSDYVGHGPMLWPELEAVFGQGSTLLAASEYPTAEELRIKWQEVLAKNDAMFAALTDDIFDEPHMRLTGPQDQDFFKTKGRCLWIWITHQMYHGGQLSVLEKPTADPLG